MSTIRIQVILVTLLQTRRILLSDAMFLTPIDIASLNRDEMDLHNQHAALVPFGKRPVNDRIIYGPLRRQSGSHETL